MCVCVFPSLDCIVEKKVASQRPIVPSSPVRTGIKNTKMLYLRMPKPINGSPGRGCAGKTSACSSIIKPDAKPHFKPSGPSTDPNSYNKARSDTERLKTSTSTKPTLDGERSSTNPSRDTKTNKLPAPPPEKTAGTAAKPTDVSGTVPPCMAPPPPLPPPDVGFNPLTIAPNTQITLSVLGTFAFPVHRSKHRGDRPPTDAVAAANITAHRARQNAPGNDATATATTTRTQRGTTAAAPG